MKQTFCDGCGQIIATKPNEVTLKSRSGFDGGCWITYEVCDDCFKEIRKKASLALQFDPNTVEGTLRNLRTVSDRPERDEWEPNDFRVI